MNTPESRAQTEFSFPTQSPRFSCLDEIPRSVISRGMTQAAKHWGLMAHLLAALGAVRRTRPQASPTIVLLLIAMTITAYWGVGQCGFVNLDDDAYVEHQPMVNQGLRPAAIVWAWTAVHSSNWHPLTSLAHIVDCDLFGLNPLPMHGVSVLWHILNTVLVYFVWRALTGATWRSAIVAALFALHPLHVESVAWISERKDVMSTFFWLVGLALYVGYVRRPSVIRYALIALALILALLAKPMAVTFPCTLLLLDLWPLRRWPTLDGGCCSEKKSRSLSSYSRTASRRSSPSTRPERLISGNVSRSPTDSATPWWLMCAILEKLFGRTRWLRFIRIPANGLLGPWLDRWRC